MILFVCPVDTSGGNGRNGDRQADGPTDPVGSVRVSTVAWQRLPHFIIHLPMRSSSEIYTYLLVIKVIFNVRAVTLCGKKIVETGRRHVLMKRNFISNCDKSSEGITEMRGCPVVNG